MKFLSKRNYATAVENLVCGKLSTGEILCAVAFWGAGAVEQYGKYFKKKNTRIVCNLMSGGTNPTVIKTLWERGIPVRTLDDLHAKVYLRADEGIIGSANCSINGLSVEEGEGWIEAGILVEDANLLKEVHEWFDGVWGRARKIDKKDFKRAEDRWERMRKNRPIVGSSTGSRTAKKKPNSLLQAMRKSPQAFEGRNIFFVVNTEDGTDAGEKRAKLEGWGDDDWYEDFWSLPEGVYIDMDDGGDVNGIYRSREHHPSVVWKENGEKHLITHVEEVQDYEGYVLTAADKSFLKPKIRDLTAKFGQTKKAKEEGSFHVPFEKVRNYLWPPSK